jgi:hypothetical protein
MTRLVLLGALLLCGCGQEAGKGGQGDADSAPATPAAQEAAGAVQDLVPDYPGSARVDVPYLGAGPDRRTGNAIAMETGDTPEQVAQYYRAHFAEQGVPVRADTANAQGGLISVARDGERGAMITISSIAGRTRIGVIRGPGG